MEISIIPEKVWKHMIYFWEKCIPDDTKKSSGWGECHPRIIEAIWFSTELSLSFQWLKVKEATYDPTLKKITHRETLSNRPFQWLCWLQEFQPLKRFSRKTSLLNLFKVWIAVIILLLLFLRVSSPAQ